MTITGYVEQRPSSHSAIGFVMGSGLERMIASAPNSHRAHPVDVANTVHQSPLEVQANRLGSFWQYRKSKVFVNRAVGYAT